MTNRIYNREDIPEDLQRYFVRAELGLEETPEQYVERMVEIFREVRRVLRDDGTVWLNLGDSYAGSWSGNSMRPEGGAQRPGGPGFQPLDERVPERGGIVPAGLKPKDLVGIPWRVAFALQADGWWLRSDIVWAKVNPMPESVTDRPTKAHEYIFLLSKSERYFYDAEAVKEPSESPEGSVAGYAGYSARAEAMGRDPSGNEKPGAVAYNSATRNKRTVWNVTTKPFPEAHFAVYPPDLIEPCIKAGTSEQGCCAECGAPMERVVERGGVRVPVSQRHAYTDDGEPVTGDNRPLRASGLPDPKIASFQGSPTDRTTVGWQPTCGHDADTVPCTVLDPFVGSGTTGVVSLRLGRDFIGIDLSDEYVEMAERRIHGDGPLLNEVAVRQVEEAG